MDCVFLRLSFDFLILTFHLHSDRISVLCDTVRKCRIGFAYTEDLMSEYSDNNTTNTTDNDDYEKVCAVCKRSERTAGKMIQMGPNMYVCPDCMQRSMDTIMKGEINF